MDTVSSVISDTTSSPISVALLDGDFRELVPREPVLLGETRLETFCSRGSGWKVTGRL